MVRSNSLYWSSWRINQIIKYYTWRHCLNRKISAKRTTTLSSNQRTQKTMTQGIIWTTKCILSVFLYYPINIVNSNVIITQLVFSMANVCCQIHSRHVVAKGFSVNKLPYWILEFQHINYYHMIENKYQARTWISNPMLWSFFCVHGVKITGDCSFCWYW